MTWVWYSTHSCLLIAYDSHKCLFSLILLHHCVIFCILQLCCFFALFSAFFNPEPFHPFYFLFFFSDVLSFVHCFSPFHSFTSLFIFLYFSTFLSFLFLTHYLFDLISRNDDRGTLPKSIEARGICEHHSQRFVRSPAYQWRQSHSAQHHVRGTGWEDKSELRLPIRILQISVYDIYSLFNFTASTWYYYFDLLSFPSHCCKAFLMMSLSFFLLWFL